MYIYLYIHIYIYIYHTIFIGCPWILLHFAKGTEGYPLGFHWIPVHPLTFYKGYPLQNVLESNKSDYILRGTLCEM